MITKLWTWTTVISLEGRSKVPWRTESWTVHLLLLGWLLGIPWLSISNPVCAWAMFNFIFNWLQKRENSWPNYLNPIALKYGPSHNINWHFIGVAATILKCILVSLLPIHCNGPDVLLIEKPLNRHVQKYVHVTEKPKLWHHFKNFLVAAPKVHEPSPFFAFAPCM